MRCRVSANTPIEGAPADRPLVGAAALGRAWFGLLLVLAYGAGLALTLAAAGFAAVRLGDRVARLLAVRSRRKNRLFSAAHRAAAGHWMCGARPRVRIGAQGGGNGPCVS